ncbi:MAG: hypothetical protein H7Y20_13925 [Bryobacteraceae bacterium]|nr:hypothetical protein [Bryobacteraceae bacterium]
MIRSFAIVILCAASFYAAAQTPDGVPKGAKEVKPGVYRLVDKSGKAWLYKKTPFGYQKSSEEPSKPEEARAAVPGATLSTPFGDSKGPRTAVVTKVTEDGEFLRFERPNPFGTSRWRSKKSELTDDERKLWDAQRATSGQTDNK